ncbi:MAG: hypothetical protein JRN39_05420 [Nitrososphaerota archaeon]|nr:hypothetical protein [Nitrososphaerota archaeon]MDG6939825.1 hypothetical protein [Nitrososphaerota archaeon]
MRRLVACLAVALFAAALAAPGAAAATTPAYAFSLLSSTASLGAGEMNNLTLTFNNTGADTLQGVVLAVSPSPYVSLVNSDGVFYMGDVDSGQNASAALTLYVSSSAPSPTYLTVQVTYNGVSQQRTLNFFVYQTAWSGSSAVAVRVLPSTLTIGEVNNLTVQIQNQAPYPINTVSVSFSFPASPTLTWLGPQTVAVPVLGAGQNETVLTQVYEPPGGPSSASLQVSASYYDPLGVARQDTGYIGFLCRGLVHFSTSNVATAPASPAVGQIFSISITLTDTGTSPAYSVTAVSAPTDQFGLFSSSSVFIGDMQAGTPTPVTIAYYVKNGTAAGQYAVPVQLTYMNNLRQNTSVTIYLPVSVSPPPAQAPGGNASSSPAADAILRTGLLAVVLSVVFLLLGYGIGRRRRRPEG